jgi:hypothetical protein
MPATTPESNKQHIEATARLIVEPGSVVELRAVGVKQRYGKPQPMNGFYDSDHLDLLAKEADRLTADAEGVYITLNPLTPDLLAWRDHRVAIAESGRAAADPHVLRRRWLLIDTDPVRLAHISATDAEKAEAAQVMQSIRDFLQAQGWPAGVLADSGNGQHTLQRIDLPADDGGLVKRVLDVLAPRFNTDMVKIDTSVFNPARIGKLYGTWARKGDNRPERPHRLAALLHVPETLAVVPRELLEALAAEHQEPVAKATSLPGKNGPAPESNGRAESNSGDFQSRLLVDKWLADRGISFEVKSRPPWTFYNLQPCPFDATHTNTDSCVMQHESGGLDAHCFHDSCKGRKWADFRDKIGKPEAHHYDPPLPEKKKIGDGPDWLRRHGVPVAKVRKLGAVKGVYDLVLTNGKIVELGTAKEVLTPRHVQAAIADIYPVVIPLRKLKDWRKIGEAILQAAKPVDCDSDPAQELQAWLEEFFGSRRPRPPDQDRVRAEAAWADEPEEEPVPQPVTEEERINEQKKKAVERLRRGEPALWVDGTYRLPLAKFLDHIRHSTPSLTRPELCRRLRRAGWKPDQPAYREGATVVNARGWSSPPGWSAGWTAGDTTT